MIQTVSGKIRKEDFGVCAAHEHLLIDLSKLKNDPDAILSNKVYMKEEMMHFYQAGGRSMVELTNEGMGRNVEKLKWLSEETGIHIVTCTGFYKDPFIPPYAQDWSWEQFAEHFIHEIQHGIGDTGIYPGIIGEVGTSFNEIKPVERELLIGAGKSSVATGIPLSTHTTLGTMGIEQIDILFGVGVPKDQIIIGHQDLNKNTDEILEVLAAGVYIGFDTIGKNNYRPDEERIELLLDLIERGFHKQILLSADLTRQSHLQQNGGPGYDIVLREFIPGLRTKGVTEDVIDDLLVNNPAKAFSVRSVQS